jgi:hypothetical protein
MAQKEIEKSGVILQSLAITLQVVLHGLAPEERSEVGIAVGLIT